MFSFTGPGRREIPLAIEYWLQAIIEQERNLDTIHPECLAEEWAILLLRSHVEGARLTLRTDHHALLWILNVADATGNLAR